MSTFFQIDFEVIRTIRSKNFSFSFAENISEFITETVESNDCRGMSGKDGDANGILAPM